MATDFLFEVNEPKWEEKKPVDLENISAATIYSKSLNKKEIRDLRRKQTAKEAMEGFEKGLEIFGFTKGQFSLCDLLAAILDKTGKSELVISTMKQIIDEIWAKQNRDLANQNPYSAEKFFFEEM